MHVCIHTYLHVYYSFIEYRTFYTNNDLGMIWFYLVKIKLMRYRQKYTSRTIYFSSVRMNLRIDAPFLRKFMNEKEHLKKKTNLLILIKLGS